MVVRFKGADGDYGQLVAVLEGPDGDRPGGQMKIFYASRSAFLRTVGQAVVGRVAGRAGCPFYRPSGRN